MGATRRPHYHLILFALELPDLCEPSKTQSGFVQYKSPSLERVWSDRETGTLRGFVDVSYADRGAFSYVAGYVHKKLGNPKDAADYMRVHPVTGEVLQVRPEFARMSRKPGIGGRGLKNTPTMTRVQTSSSGTAKSAACRNTTVGAVMRWTCGAWHGCARGSAR